MTYEDEQGNISETPFMVKNMNESTLMIDAMRGANTYLTLGLWVSLGIYYYYHFEYQRMNAVMEPKTEAACWLTLRYVPLLILEIVICSFHSPNDAVAGTMAGLLGPMDFTPQVNRTIVDPDGTVITLDELVPASEFGDADETVLEFKPSQNF